MPRLPPLRKSNRVNAEHGLAVGRFPNHSSALTLRQRAFVFFQALSAALLSICILTTPACRRSLPPADLVIINGQDPESLDPAIITGLEDYRAAPALFEGLTRSDPETARAIPGLAESWDVSPDGLRYRFHLRSGLRWSTGGPLTANDVVYSWIRLLDPSTAADYAAQLFCLKNAEDFSLGKIKDPKQVGVHALDASTVLVELHQPVVYFLDLCASPTLAVVPQLAIEAHGDRWLTTLPVPCSGPYSLEVWRLNDRIRFRRNPNYWDDMHTRNGCVDLLPVSSPTTALNLYESGAADIIWDKDMVPAELLPALRVRKDYHHFNYIGAYFIRFNVTRKPFGDPRVRRALALAIDKGRIVDRVVRGGEPAAGGLVPPGVANHLPPETLPHDLEAARRLLSEAGFPGGRGFPRCSYLFDSAAGGGANVHGKIAVELQEMWKRELGIDLELRQMEKKVYLAAQSALDYDLARSSWVGDYNDPSTFLDLFLANNGNNRTGWSHPKYEALLSAAAAEPNAQKRAALLRDAETLLVRDEVPIIPLYSYLGFQFYNPDRIAGIYGNILGMNPIRVIHRKPSSP